MVVPRYHYYAFRGGPKFWTSDGKRLDMPAKRLPGEFIEAYQAAIEEVRGPSKGSFAATIVLYRSNSASFRKMEAERTSCACEVPSALARDDLAQ